MASEPDWEDVARDLLSASWNNTNTDSITPAFFISGEGGERLQLGGNTSAIIIYKAGHVTEPNSVGSSTERIFARISFDIRTFKSRDHKLNVYNEIRRIIALGIINTTDPTTSYQYIIPLGIMKDEDRAAYWRRVYDVRLLQYNLAR